MLMDYEGKVKVKKFDPRISHDMLAEAIIKHDLPYTFVEHDKIRAWAKYVNPDVVMLSRNTVVSDVQRIHLREKEKLKQAMAKIPNRICLTSDLCSKLLNFCRMPPPHTGVELATTVFDCLKEWGIDRKVFSLTLDNASANDNMQVNEALFKIRESVKYVKASDGRMKKFQECVQHVGIDVGVGLHLDVSTRWNSTYLMLESAIKYQKAFASLQFVDRTYKYNPSDEEWGRAMIICEFLEPFYETTNLIFGSSYPTSNLYFKQVWKIESILNENLFNEDEVIKDMCQRMKMKFDKYWKDYSVLLAFGAVLDPRMKLDFLRFCYSKIDASTCDEKLENVKTKLYELFEQYASNTCASSTSSRSTSNLPKQAGGGTKPKGSKIFSEFKMFQNETISIARKSELDVFLDEAKLDNEVFEDLDVLNYWKNNAKRFPDLSIMARDVLNIPNTR
ncbi:HAT [Theobroma cacao]|nr:HAT [Theobroma cacao]